MNKNKIIHYLAQAAQALHAGMMDEATPHIHIDFVPVATEQKRGLAKRVSLKPVSYTHLDVYKRQPFDSVADWMRALNA